MKYSRRHLYALRINISIIEQNLLKLSMMSQSSDVSNPLSQESYDLLMKNLEDQDYTRMISHNNFTIADIESHEEEYSTTLQINQIQIDRIDDVLSTIPLKTESSQPVLLNSSFSEPPPAQQFSSHVPSFQLSTTAMPGDYNFRIDFDEAPKLTKAVDFTYSTLLQMLFVRFEAVCAVKFHTSRPPPAGSVICVMPLFLKPEHLSDVVRRCPTHAAMNNENHPAPTHLIRSEHRATAYFDDPVSGQQCNVVPYSPTDGRDYMTNCYQFMCYSSCIGGLNRRPVQAIFTLEHNGQVLGRQAIKVRICACPGRDRRSKEKQMNKSTTSGAQEGTASTDSVQVAPRCDKRSSAMVVGETKITSYGPTPTKKSRLDMMETFSVPVRGRENYEFLLKLRDALELASVIPQSIIDKTLGTMVHVPPTIELLTQATQTSSQESSQQRSQLVPIQNGPLQNQDQEVTSSQSSPDFSETQSDSQQGSRKKIQITTCRLKRTFRVSKDTK